MDTLSYIIREDALDLVPEVLAKHWGKAAKPRIVADRNTWTVGGERLSAALAKAGLGGDPPFIFPGPAEVYADDKSVALVAAALSGEGIVGIALGSGTINDLVKRASFELGKTYLCVPTAPSVDGYTSFGAAITVEGFKRTLPCPAPRAVVADSSILRKAPYPMIAAGYCDLAAKVPAGADWLIADALGSQRIVGEVWDLAQKNLRDQIGSPEAIAARDAGAIDKLFSGLAQVGFAMQKLQDTRPASGADHLFSHVWEMAHLEKDGAAVSHGFKVAIGTLASTAMMTEMLEIGAAQLPGIFAAHPGKTWEEREKEVRAALAGEPILDATLGICRAKHLEGPALQARRATILDHWDEVKDKVRGQILPFGRLRAMFEAASAPSQPADIGLTKALMEKGLRAAQMIRTRYTILDYLCEIGVFDEVVAKLMDGRSYFSQYRS